MNAEEKDKVESLIDNKEHDKALYEMIKISAPLSVELCNTALVKSDNEVIGSLALLGASVAITKTAGHVTLRGFLEAATMIWNSQEAQFIDEPLH